MSKFVRVRPLEQIRRTFVDHLFTVDDERYRQGLDDLVVFKDGVIAGTFIWTVLVNPANGRFICSRTGTETMKEMATEESGELKGTPWYDELVGMVFRMEELEGGAK